MRQTVTSRSLLVRTASLLGAFGFVGVAPAAVPAWLVSGRRVLADLRS